MYKKDMKGLIKMSKVKLTTVSGQVIEKPVVSCFKGTYGTYLILDNEANGSMGLPIIFVTKIFNNKAIYIDDTEWATVKANLKSIIAGEKFEYTTVPNEMPADDVFYKQLTLPVNSFDMLKKSYENNNIGASSIGNTVTPATSESTPIADPINVAPVMPSEAPTPTEPTPVAPPMPEQPVTPTVEPTNVPPMPNIAPIDSNPVSNEIPPVAPVMPSESPTPIEPTPVVPPMPEQPTPEVNNNVNYEELKTNFMQSCESMFDALVSKMQNK
jgi:hypothetical protein